MLSDIENETVKQYWKNSKTELRAEDRNVQLKKCEEDESSIPAPYNQYWMQLKILCSI